MKCPVTLLSEIANSACTIRSTTNHGVIVKDDGDVYVAILLKKNMLRCVSSTITNKKRTHLGDLENER